MLIYIYICIGLEGWIFANVPEDRDSIPGRVILRTQKIILDISILNIQHYKVRISGNVQQYKETRSNQ